MSAFVYLLHFDDPLSNAQHYAGCTRNLPKRLEAHASGRGSRICRELFKRGIGWKLISLWIVSDANMYAVERHLKDSHNMRTHCELCSGSCTRPLSKAVYYDVANLPFMPHTNYQPVGPFAICTATEEDIVKATPQILRLMQDDRGALGFIPAGGAEGINYHLAKGKIALAIRGDKIVGYILFTWLRKEPNPERVKIHQICVADEARHEGIGRALVEHVQGMFPGVQLQCNVRDNLPANTFWKAIGFTRTHEFKHKTSGAKLHHYERKCSSGNL